MSWLLKIRQLLRYPSNDRIIRSLQRVGFERKSIFTLMLNAQFRKVIQQCDYGDQIAVLSQRGSEGSDCLKVTLYLTTNGKMKKDYRIFLVTSSSEYGLCVFKDAPELVIPYNFNDELLYGILTSWIASIVTLYVARKATKPKNEKELKVKEKVL